MQIRERREALLKRGLVTTSGSGLWRPIRKQPESTHSSKGACSLGVTAVVSSWRDPASCSPLPQFSAWRLFYIRKKKSWWRFVFLLAGGEGQSPSPSFLVMSLMEGWLYWAPLFFGSCSILAWIWLFRKTECIIQSEFLSLHILVKTMILKLECGLESPGRPC